MTETIIQIVYFSAQVDLIPHSVTQSSITCINVASSVICSQGWGISSFRYHSFTKLQVPVGLCDFFLITLCLCRYLHLSARLVLSRPLLKPSHMLGAVGAGGKPQVDPTPPLGLASVPRTQIHVAGGHAMQQREGSRKFSVILMTTWFDWLTF